MSLAKSSLLDTQCDPASIYMDSYRLDSRSTMTFVARKAAAVSARDLTDIPDFAHSTEVAASGQQIGTGTPGTAIQDTDKGECNSPVA